MKVSMYSFLFEIEDRFYVYNTLSNALIEIDGDLFILLQTSKNNHMAINKTDLDSDGLFQVLKDNRIVTADDRDEFLLFKSIILSGRSADILNLTIAPTMDCNYSCSYCFESCKRSVYMTEDVMEAITRFIEQHENTKDIHVVWFGGEPLMGIDQIKMLYRKLSKIPSKNYSYSMITNGFLISLNVIRLFKEMGLQYLQITLDGLKESHNKVKFTETCDDTFTKTIENIDLLVSSAPEIRVVVRVNMNKGNFEEFVELYGYITERYKDFPQVSIYPAFVTASSFESNEIQSILFTRQEKSRFIRDLYNEKGIMTYLCQYPNSTFMECSTRNKKTYAIDPEGYLYKCWEIIGDQKYAIGKLSVDGGIETVDWTILNRYLYGSDPLDDKICTKCPYLPICFGGCPHKRIENEYIGKRYDICTHLKGTLKEFVKIHLMSKASEKMNIS